MLSFPRNLMIRQTAIMTTQHWGEECTESQMMISWFCFFVDGDISAKKTDEISKKRNVLKKFEL